jgi:peptide/nickel transport system ATP-binding protein
MSAVLAVENLAVRFGPVQAVRKASFTVNKGETHCIVGESGCGKSVTSLAIMNLLARNARREADAIHFAGQDILGFSDRQMEDIRGNRMAMIFQEPMTSLNPSYTIGSQMTEVMRRHQTVTQAQAQERAISLMGRVGITAPEMRLRQYPHQLSGGLRQRVMIAMALMCEPELLIADEPTTALDVTVQAQILRLLNELKQEMGLGILLITHDLGIVARVADHVSVMYAGEVIETGRTKDIFSNPVHPYTRGLIDCVPVPGKIKPGEPLGSIPGTVPVMKDGFSGCAFRFRCEFATESCAVTVPRHDLGNQHQVACRLSAPQNGARS